MIITCPKCGRVIQLDSAGKEQSKFNNHNCIYATALTLFESRKGIIQPAEVMETIWGNPCVPDSSKVKIRLNDHTICWVGEGQTYATLHNPAIPIKQVPIKKTIHKKSTKDRSEYMQIPINTLHPGTEFFDTLNGPKWIVEENYFGEIKIKKICDGYTRTLMNNYMSVYVVKKSIVSSQDKERQVA